MVIGSKSKRYTLWKYLAEAGRVFRFLYTRCTLLSWAEGRWRRRAVARFSRGPNGLFRWAALRSSSQEISAGERPIPSNTNTSYLWDATLVRRCFGRAVRVIRTDNGYLAGIPIVGRKRYAPKAR